MKQGMNNEVSFVEIILHSWQFIIVTTRCLNLELNWEEGR